MSAGRRLRIGIFGGTFDPVHHVHLLIAAEAARALDLDQVRFVPVGQPSHKDPRRVAPAADRYAMARLATAPYPRLAVDSVDLRRPGPTYTVDTLRDLHREHPPGTEFYFIAGADTLARVPTWHRAGELPGLAHFVGSVRPGHPPVEPGLVVVRATLPRRSPMEVSATTVRDRSRAGDPIDLLVPGPVADYIRRRGLYRGSPVAGT